MFRSSTTKGFGASFIPKQMRIPPPSQWRKFVSRHSSCVYGRQEKHFGSTSLISDPNERQDPTAILRINVHSLESADPKATQCSLLVQKTQQESFPSHNRIRLSFFNLAFHVKEKTWRLINKMDCGFPGEAAGLLRAQWRPWQCELSYEKPGIA